MFPESHGGGKVFDIDVPFRNKPSVDIYSQHFDQLTADQYREKLLELRLRAVLCV